MCAQYHCVRLFWTHFHTFTLQDLVCCVPYVSLMTKYIFSNIHVAISRNSETSSHLRNISHSILYCHVLGTHALLRTSKCQRYKSYYTLSCICFRIHVNMSQFIIFIDSSGIFFPWGFVKNTTRAFFARPSWKIAKKALLFPACTSIEPYDQANGLGSFRPCGLREAGG